MKQLMTLVILVMMTLGSYALTFAAMDSGSIIIIMGGKVAATIDSSTCYSTPDTPKQVVMLDKQGNTLCTQSFTGDVVNLNNTKMEDATNILLVTDACEMMVPLGK